MMVFTRKIEYNQERSFWISKLWKYFSKYFVLIPRYVVSVMFLQNTRLYSCFCPDYPVTFLDQSEERSTSHLMNSRPIAELVFILMFVKFYNMSILLLLVVKLVKITSVQPKISFIYFLPIQNTWSALILDPTLWNNWPLIDNIRGDNRTSELDIENF